jgi:hypothetical protein
MEESILAPIGLVVGIINTCAKSIKAVREFGFNQQPVRQEIRLRRIHSPIQGRSPPLSA